MMPFAFFKEMCEDRKNKMYLKEDVAYSDEKPPMFSVNKNPTRCNSMQIFIFCKVTLHVSGVTAPIIRGTKNCNGSLRYRSYCKIQGLTGMN